MRTIKFRAWDKDKKWMVYDVQDAYDGLWSERNSDEINDYYGYVSTFQSFTDEEDFNFMQYTGLKDKNGVEIFEGDIVSVHDGKHIKPIIFYQGAFFAEDLFPYEVPYDCKVIGNIYENSELIS